MNKKVLKTMIWLVIGELVAWYILKIFFPEQFVMVIQNENITKLGSIIDSQLWSACLLGACTSFITYWLYLCAVTKQWKLKWYQCLIIVCVIGTSLGFSFVDMNICTCINITSFIFLPLIFKAELKQVAIVFTVHSFAQNLILSIRDLPIYIADMTTLNVFILSIDMYLWLFLFYLYYNYKEKEV